MSLKRAEEADIEKFLQRATHWKRVENAIEREVVCKSYSKACALVLELAFAAEKLVHHPDLFWSYCTLRVRLSTHDVKGLSALDFSLAEKFDSLIKES